MSETLTSSFERTIFVETPFSEGKLVELRRLKVEQDSAKYKDADKNVFHVTRDGKKYRVEYS